MLGHPLEVVGDRFSQSIDVPLSKAIRKTAGDWHPIGLQQAAQYVVPHATGGDADLVSSLIHAQSFW